jgi:hypothetical protein
MGPSDFKNQLKQVLQSHWFLYVSAFINTTKHRKLVRHDLSVSLKDNREGVRIGSFEYKRVTYPQYWGRDVLVGVVEVKNSLIACARTLNRLCVP